MLNYALVGAVLVIYLVVGFVITLPDPPVGSLVAGAAILVVVVALIGFPFAKTLWAAVDLLVRGDDQRN